MQERIVILGALGQLGSLIKNIAPANIELHAFDVSEFDISNLAQHQSLYQELAPTTIINTAGYTQVDKAESEQEDAFAVNAEGPANIAKACSESCRIIHISTDFIFDGEKQAPYMPSDLASPLSVYGASKLAGEEKLQTIRPDSSIIRTAWLYSAQGKNFMNMMLNLMAELEELAIVNDQIGTPTSAHTLAEVVWRFVANRELKGIYHWTDQGAASWYDFAVEIKQQALAIGLLEKDISLRAISTQEYPTPAQRPKYSVLDKSDTYKAIQFQGKSWQEELNTVLRERLPIE
ncbi:MAG: dTDP-4-dehydrorhamnose reductase [Gammaproteobacteria bacterium]|jgi:dTDP-4-dehydrorhamnose reductase|nr:dTDP-4-dehydrorhamnose reductase [Gammaproteobacteria bacterium]